MSASEDVRREMRASDASPSVIEPRARLIYLISGAVVIALVFFYLQYSTKAICCGDFDGYYHIRWSRSLWESFSRGGRLPTFDALPLTTLNARDYVDHHFLFHVLQMPFTSLGSDLHTGAKISAWFFATLGVFACYWMIVRYEVRYPLLWLLALVGSSNAFLYRMNMTKAMPFSLALLIVGLVLLFERRYKWLGVLSFVYVWAYSLWFLLPIAVMIWAGVVLWSERRVEWRAVAACAAGSVAGLIVNPYFPKNIKLFYEHARMKLAPSGFPTQVGQEWYPWDTRQFIAQLFIALVAMLIGYIAFNWRDRRAAAKPLFFLIFATLLMLMTAYSKRFNEYFPPFAIIFAAFTLRPLLARERETAATLPPEVMDELQPYLDRTPAPEDHARDAGTRARDDEAIIYGLTLAIVAGLIVTRLALSNAIEFSIAAAVIALGVAAFMFLRRGRAAVAFIAAIGLGVALFSNVTQTARDIADEGTQYAFRQTPDRFRDAMAWVRTNVPEGELIFNTNWDHFPKLYFESPRHAYASGLDPNYLLDQNPELARLYDEIKFGKEKNAAPLIREKFGARFIFTDQEQRDEDFFHDIMRTGWVERAYSDDFATVLRIRDERGEVPAEYADENEEDDAANPDADEQDEDASEDAGRGSN